MSGQKTQREQPISEEDLGNYNEINPRNKPIIVNTLISEYQRATKLAQEFGKAEKIAQEALANCTIKGPDNETPETAKNRLEASIRAIREKIKSIGFREVNNLFKPKFSTDGDNHSDDSNENLQDKSFNKSYKIDSNTKSFSGLPGDAQDNGFI